MVAAAAATIVTAVAAVQVEQAVAALVMEQDLDQGLLELPIQVEVVAVRHPRLEQMSALAALVGQVL